MAKFLSIRTLLHSFIVDISMYLRLINIFKPRAKIKFCFISMIVNE